jgi:hypothetical protein
MVGISAEFMDRIMDRAEWGKRYGRLPQVIRTGLHREFFESPEPAVVRHSAVNVLGPIV